MLTFGGGVRLVDQKLWPGVGLKILLGRVARHEIGFEHIILGFGIAFGGVGIGDALVQRASNSDVVGIGLTGVDIEPFGRGRIHAINLVKIIELNSLQKYIYSNFL